MKPTARLRVALRAALRRRYAYAALRVLRRGLVRALEDDMRRSVGPDTYASELDALGTVFWQGLKRLERRFRRPPPFEDPRSLP